MEEAMEDDLVAGIWPVVVGARVGDAMGTPTERLEPAEIGRRYGWVSDFSGDGTDDSLMANLLSEALVGTGGEATIDDWAAQWTAGEPSILAKQDRFFLSVLHTLAKLRHGWAPRRVALGNMASSSSAMCIWPVGVVNAGQPSAAAAQAYALAALIHVGDVDFCQDGAAMIAAAVAAGLRPGTDISGACGTALEKLHQRSGALMRALVTEAIELARESASYEEFRSCYHSRYRQEILCDSRETVPAAAALAVLAEGDLVRGVEYGANFGRDADTIASMVGALCGAVSHGQVPQSWITRLGPEAAGSARALSLRLAEAAREKAARRREEIESLPGLGGAARR